MTAPARIRIHAQQVAVPGLELLAPGGIAWVECSELRIPLTPTPLKAQPSAYVQAAWAVKPYGTLTAVNVSAAIADYALFVRLRWSCSSPVRAITDNDVFADACAVMFPADGADGQAPLMGEPGRPVELWQWRAGTDAPFVLTATGPGTSTRLGHHAVAVASEWSGDRWTVVFRRALDAPGVTLGPGHVVPAGFAVWQGSNSERAGLAAHTPDWISLDIAR